MKVALLGYYGAGNAGDEAILESLLCGLKELKDLKITVVSKDRYETEQLHNVESVARNSITGFHKLLKEYDAWIVGGGGIIQDVTGPYTLPYYLSLFNFIQKTTKPMFFHAQGIGPIRNRLFKAWAKSILNRAKRVSVRDEASLRFLLQEGICKKKLFLGADPVFLSTKPKSSRMEKLKQKYALFNEKNIQVLGVALRDWKGKKNWLPPLLRSLKKLHNENRIHIMLIPFDRERDTFLNRYIFKKLNPELKSNSVSIIEDNSSYKERLDLLHACDGVIAMRLHAVIFAALGMRKGVALAYDPKVSQIAKALHWPCFELQRINETLVFDAIIDCLQSDHKHSPDIQKALDEQQGLAQKDLSGLVEALENLEV